MKVEIWSDFVCPWCYIGKRRFESALERFAGRDGVEVVYRSFELNPESERDGNPGVIDMLAEKYGMSREQAAERVRMVTELAGNEGLVYHMDRAIQTNTFDAHRLAHFAAARGKLKEMTERLLKAHFTDSLHLGDSQVLADLAGEVGLDRAEALEALEGGAYAEQVRQDEWEAAMLGVRGVPFFVFNRKYAVSGAQPAEVFARVLEQTWSEERPLVVAGEENEAAACGADGCELPGKKE